MKDRFLKNLATGIIGQLFITLLGIIVPKMMIGSYGSDAFGLLSTVTQIFTYLAILEAGIGQATRNALYNPIVEKDNKQISEVLSTSKAYFGKATRYYLLAVIVLSFLAPIFIKTNIDKTTVFLIVILEGLSGVLSFYYVETYRVLINSDGLGYVNNIISFSNVVISYLAKIILAYLGTNILFLELVFFLITIVKVFIYKRYFKRKYKNILLNIKPNFSLLKDRKPFVITEISGTVFSSTDMIVLSLFMSTSMSSVYAVYNMIFLNFNNLLYSISNSVNYKLGITFHEDIKKYEKVHDSFTSFYICLMTIFMSVCYIFTIPFMKLYMSSTTEINYIYQALPILFCVVQLLSWSRNVSGNLTGLAGYAKQTSYISLIEAITNIVLSIILVNKFGITGVLLGTVIALPIKVVWCTYIADRKVLNRSFWNSLKILGSNYLLFTMVVIISNNFSINVLTYGDLILKCVLTTFLIGAICILMNILINKDLINVVKKYVVKKQ